MIIFIKSDKSEVTLGCLIKGVWFCAILVTNKKGKRIVTAFYKQKATKINGAGTLQFRHPEVVSD